MGLAIVSRAGAAEDAVPQRHVDFFTFVDCALGDTASSMPQSIFRDELVLSHVTQLTCEVARVGGLERGIS